MTDTLSLLRTGKLAGATRLDLACGLTEFPREIFDLAESLEVLNLTDNRLSSLPGDLHRLSKLKILFCSSNEFRELPAVIGQCPALEMVAFKSNAIAKVPEEAFAPQLRWLILTDNQIPELPASIGRCHRLQKLMLAGNRLSALPAEMANCHALELLRLSANRFGSLPPWLFSLPRLAWLAISGNPMSPSPDHADPIGKIGWNELQIHEVLGEGASGTIHRATWGERLVAVKIFKGAMTSDGLPADEMAACLAAGSHPHLIPIVGKIANHPQAAEGLVMEFIPDGFSSLAAAPSWESCTRDVYDPDTRFGCDALLGIAGSMAKVGSHLHAGGILHGDLYAHNMLANAAGECYLGDFGAASFHPPGVPAAALERLEVRAFGCLLEELVDRCEDAPPALRELRDRCLSARVAERPPFAEITRVLEDIVRP
ncbi:leucine-rich repeat-containing protein kinase family protein [Haloferula sp. BvORR071]|uniref:leucine-rich repeat-containing protein kinase family protein n=1 Tax=Haloferula sp. BvORR071 TaxID=1396141 RepID=UPI000558AB27|nr:leucine-rich repeat-containing protein kinase family protein [Haloferula sp. BvORR071]